MQSSSVIRVACLLVVLLSATAATAKASNHYQAALTGFKPGYNKYVTFTATITLDFSVPNKVTYSVIAHARGIYQVDILDLNGANVLTLYHNAHNDPVGRPGGPSGAVSGHLIKGTATRSRLNGSLKGHSIAALKGLCAGGAAAGRLEGQFPVVADAANTVLRVTGVFTPSN